MQQHGSKYCARRHPGIRGLGQKVKIKLFQNMVRLHIKLNGIANAPTCKPIFFPFTHHRPLGWGQWSKHVFLKVVILHIKLEGIEA